MYIIVPINIEALRVSPDTMEKAKTALYDFGALDGAGQSPLSTGLIAANNFDTAETKLSEEPGIHLHWSIPKAYTQGKQDASDGSIRFPGLPNRWLVTRYFKDLTNQATSVTSWILESDMHSSHQESTGNSATTIPWMDNSGELTGMEFHYAGKKTLLSGAGQLPVTWREPGPGDQYLGSNLQAPFGYGETFTAYYRNCGNLFGMYDDLKDIYPSSYSLNKNKNFSVSYMVAGWVSQPSNDACLQVLTKAAADFALLPGDGKVKFEEYIGQALQEQLKWTLCDNSGFTPDATDQTQPVMSGILAAIPWKIEAPGDVVYPSSLPDSGSITTTMGNSMPEAVSAYLNLIEKGKLLTDPGAVQGNMEWLLNAMQSGRLPYLGNGEMGIGQLSEYLHSKAFGSRNGGYLWTTRGLMTPGNKASPKEEADRMLPLFLGRLLACLNDSQRDYDRLCDEISSRQKKCFFDWNYHVNALQQNVIPSGPSSNLMADDNSRDYLLEGLMNLFPLFIRAGTQGLTTDQDGPYVYNPASFQMHLPAASSPGFPGLSGYTFNKAVNGNADAAAAGLLDAFHRLGDIIPENLDKLRESLQTALQVLDTGGQQETGKTDFIGLATSSLQTAQILAQALSDDFEKAAGASGILADISSRINKDIESLAILNDPTQGFFKYLPVSSTQSIPLAAGEKYLGSLGSAYSNAWNWEQVKGFPGMGVGIDQCTGQGNYQSHLFDIQQAGIYLAIAYFWRRSQETASKVTPYYIQLAQWEIGQALMAARTAGTAVQNSLVLLAGSGPITLFGETLSSLAAEGIPALLTDLGGSTPNVEKIVTVLRGWLTMGTTDGWTIPDLTGCVQSDDWGEMLEQLESAWTGLLQRLPLAHQVSLLSSYLSSQIRDAFELSPIPADPYWEPGEPVLLMAENNSSDELLKPVNRNGRAAFLPCRWDKEIVTGALTLPDAVSGLSAQLDPAIEGLNTVLQRLAAEALFLGAEFNTADQVRTLSQAAGEIMPQQEQAPGTITLAQAPAGLTGTLPYYIAYNWWTGEDPFLPLFIFWQVEYVYSKRFDFESRQLAADSLADFTPDPYGIDYQPVADSTSFDPDPLKPNFFTVSGVIPLSSASTANLCEQVRQYCLNNLGFDPAADTPDGSDPDGKEKLDLYHAYIDFRTRHFLSQSLSGFNASMLQRVQELQLPVNIPPSWIDDGSSSGSSSPGFSRSVFWPSQLLLDQSSGWPHSWKSEALDLKGFLTDGHAVFFNPLRAGFLKVSQITLVDAFGRSMLLPQSTSSGQSIPAAIAESMQSQTVSVTDHPVYLPPRLVQPSRLSFQWVSGKPSPVCGWLLPNHLDDSLMAYNSDGRPLGSLRHAGNDVHWITVPGESYAAGVDNHTLMTDDLAKNETDAVFVSFLEKFIYPATGELVTGNFQKFLTVADDASQFIVTKAMQEDPALAVLIGQPLVVVKATLKWELKGLPNVSLDKNTYAPWNGSSDQFQLDNNGFIPYDFDNFNDGGIRGLQIPVSVGAVDYLRDGQPIVFFDDGLVGYFVNDDFSRFYTPVNTTDEYQIRSTCQPNSQPVILNPAGNEVTITMIMDPRAAVHVSSGLLPVKEIILPQDQYERTLNKLMVTFLAAPVLQGDQGLRMPLPSETGYDWSWWQIGSPHDEPLTPAQANSDAFFNGGPQTIIDGWLKLKKKETK